jgi:hypothetical protein
MMCLHEAATVEGNGAVEISEVLERLKPHRHVAGSRDWLPCLPTTYKREPRILEVQEHPQDV